MMKRYVWAATMLATSTVGFSALGQQAAATGETSTAVGVGTTGNVSAEATQAAAPSQAAAAAPANAPAAAPAADAAAAGSDHEAMVGRIAFGYLGYVNIPYGEMGGAGPNFSPAAAVAPVIGMRLWLNSTLGIDAGLGLTTTFGTHQAPDPTTAGATVSTNATAPTGLAVHFGMPLALKAARHYTFEIIPEMNIGYAQQAISSGANGQDLSGLHLDIGARAGAELHFGFIGIPELSLVGSVGLRADINQTKTETRVGNNTTTVKDSRTVIQTTVGDNPWNIFVGNVSAFYYL